MKDYQINNKRTFYNYLATIIKHLEDINIDPLIIKKAKLLGNSVLYFEDINHPISISQVQKILSLKNEEDVQAIIREIETSIVNKNLLLISNHTDFLNNTSDAFINEFKILINYCRAMSFTSDNDLLEELPDFNRLADKINIINNMINEFNTVKKTES